MIKEIHNNKAFEAIFGGMLCQCGRFDAKISMDVVTSTQTMLLTVDVCRRMCCADTPPPSILYWYSIDGEKTFCDSKGNGTILDKTLRIAGLGTVSSRY